MRRKTKRGMANDLLITGDDAPGCVHGGVIEARHNVAHGGNALLERIEDLLQACGLGKLEVWRRDLILLSAANNSSGHEGKVICQLPGKWTWRRP